MRNDRTIRAGFSRLELLCELERIELQYGDVDMSYDAPRAVETRLLILRYLRQRSINAT